jgi:hypothetical protein
MTRDDRRCLVELKECIISMLEKAGDSSQVSRDAVLSFHGSPENLREAAELWADHHGVWSVLEGDIVIAYATAVDLGYRIARLEAKNGT